MKIIYTQPDGTVAIVVPAAGWGINDVLAKDVPEGSNAEIVEDSVIPSDRTFRNAWRKGAGRVDIDLPAARGIAHDRRRARRDEEMKPYDEIIAKQIPGQDAAQAEIARAAIRVRYVDIQNDIDAVVNVDALTGIVNNL